MFLNIETIGNQLSNIGNYLNIKKYKAVIRHDTWWCSSIKWKETLIIIIHNVIKFIGWFLKSMYRKIMWILYREWFICWIQLLHPKTFCYQYYLFADCRNAGNFFSLRQAPGFRFRRQVEFSHIEDQEHFLMEGNKEHYRPAENDISYDVNHINNLLRNVSFSHEGQQRLVRNEV